MTYGSRLRVWGVATALVVGAAYSVVAGGTVIFDFQEEFDAGGWIGPQGTEGPPGTFVFEDVEGGFTTFTRWTTTDTAFLGTEFQGEPGLAPGSTFSSTQLSLGGSFTDFVLRVGNTSDELLFLNYTVNGTGGFIGIFTEFIDPQSATDINVGSLVSGQAVRDISFDSYNISPTFISGEGNDILNRPGATPGNPILPVVENGEFIFGFDVESTDDLVFIDPTVAIGYRYVVDSGPNIDSVLLPTGVGDDLYDLFLFDEVLQEFVDSGLDLIGGVAHFFAPSGVDQFLILGIEPGAGLDPNDPLAFVTGLSFSGVGSVSMRQIPVVSDTNPGSVPEPATLFLFALGGLLLVGERIRERVLTRWLNLGCLNSFCLKSVVRATVRRAARGTHP